MTLTEILSTFRELADDTAASNNLWSDTTLLLYLREAQIEAARRTRMFEDRDTVVVCSVPVTANTTTYSVDSRVLFVRRVKASWADQPLVKVRPQDLDAHEPGWEAATAVAEPRWWMPWSNSQLRIEKPSANGSLTLWVVRDPLVRPRLSATAAAVTSITSAAGVATVTLAAAPAVPLVDGDTVTIAGAAQSDYNVDDQITVVSPTVFTYDVLNAPVSPATGTITAAIATAELELPSRYHQKLVDWMLFRALSMRDKEEKYDPKSAADHLALFEQEFGPRSSAIDETWIKRQHGYDDHEGLY